jgi:uncharacterized protein (TIGR02265 family)
VTAIPVTPTEPLTGNLDVEATIESVPPSYRLRGMFFKSLLDRLGTEWSALEAQLLEPPRGGRYLAFRDYPQRDYTRLHFAAAAKEYPGLGNREAVRRLSRLDFDVFAQSVLGRVIVAMVRDAKSALHKLPTVYEKVAPGDWHIAVEDLNDHTVRLVFSGFDGCWEYQLGQLEGIATAFGARPRISTTVLGVGHFRFDVELL